MSRTDSHAGKSLYKINTNSCLHKAEVNEGSRLTNDSRPQEVVSSISSGTATQMVTSLRRKVAGTGQESGAALVPPYSNILCIGLPLIHLKCRYTRELGLNGKVYACIY